MPIHIEWSAIALRLVLTAVASAAIGINRGELDRPYLLPLGYLGWSLLRGERAGSNPWRATGLEWQTSSPPPTYNFARTPVVTTEPYAYNPEDGSFIAQDGTAHAY